MAGDTQLILDRGAAMQSLVELRRNGKLNADINLLDEVIDRVLVNALQLQDPPADLPDTGHPFGAGPYLERPPEPTPGPLTDPNRCRGVHARCPNCRTALCFVASPEGPWWLGYCPHEDCIETHVRPEHAVL